MNNITESFIRLEKLTLLNDFKLDVLKHADAPKFFFYMRG